jgi:hypothetical protein
MTTPERPADDPLLRVLRDHLEQQEKALAADALRSRIVEAASKAPTVEQSKGPESDPRQRRRWATWSVVIGSGAIAASILLTIFLMPSAEARAELAVREADATLKLPVERCYLVEVQREGGDAMEEPLPTRTVRVWTTGDRFRVEVARGKLRWAWGRDTDGSVWIVSNPQKGVRIAPDEQGPGLQWACDLYGLRPETVLHEVLAHFRLREEPGGELGHRRVIRAEPRAWARLARLQSAVLELDADTRAIRKLALTNKAIGGGMVTTTFTLVDVRPADEARFRLEGHLTEPFQIYDQDFEPTKRREILSRWLGPKVDRWLRPSNSKKS